LTLANPLIRKLIPKDPILSLPALEYAAMKYAGGEKLNHPNLSPLYGKMSNLGKVLLFYATDELFYPDCRQIEEKMNLAEGTEVEVVVGQDLFHTWPLFPIPEGISSQQQIIDYINQT
jgi:hypothetical protein